VSQEGLALWEGRGRERQKPAGRGNAADGSVHMAASPLTCMHAVVHGLHTPACTPQRALLELRQRMSNQILFYTPTVGPTGHPCGQTHTSDNLMPPAC